MKRTVVDRPIAKEGNADIVTLQQLERVSGAGRLQNTGPDDAARAHHPNLRLEKMHAATAPLRTAGGPTEKLSHHLTRADTFGQRVPVSPVRAENSVVRAQMRANACGNRLLAYIGMAGAVNQPHLVRAGQLLLCVADGQQLPVKREKLLRLGYRIIPLHGGLVGHLFLTPLA